MKSELQTDTSEFNQRASFAADDWENHPSIYGEEDVDFAALQRFRDRAVNAKRLPPEAVADAGLLRRLALLEGDQLNHGGAALFSKQGPIPLKMAVFATNEKLTFIDQCFVEDNIINLLDKAEDYVKKNIRWRAEFANGTRIDIPEIPIVALREALANAFAHALYKSGTQHEICIMPNYVTIYNPGPYANPHTPEDYINGEFPSVLRNERISKVLYLNHSSEQFGSGFKRIDQLCKADNVQYDHDELDYGFKFIFFRRYDPHFNDEAANKRWAAYVEEDKKRPKVARYWSHTDEKGFRSGGITYEYLDEAALVLNDAPRVLTPPSDLTRDEMAILKLLNFNPYASRQELAAEIGKTVRTVQRHLDALKEKGYIARQGATKNGYWKILKKPQTGRPGPFQY